MTFSPGDAVVELVSAAPEKQAVKARQLEAALATYPGTLLLVTHDRRMLQAITVNRRIELAGGTITSR